MLSRLLWSSLTFCWHAAAQFGPHLFWPSQSSYGYLVRVVNRFDWFSVIIYNQHLFIQKDQKAAMWNLDLCGYQNSIRNWGKYLNPFSHVVVQLCVRKLEDQSLASLLLGFSSAVFSISKIKLNLCIILHPRIKLFKHQNNLIFLWFKVGSKVLFLFFFFCHFTQGYCLQYQNIFRWYLHQKRHKKHCADLSNLRSHLASQHVCACVDRWMDA